MEDSIVEKWKTLLNLVPEAPEWKIDWNAVEQSKFKNFSVKMKKTWQNPVWHGEGDVWTHTQMVCEELVKLPAYRKLERRKQQEVFLATLLHDIGKIPCTRMENGVWTSPNHTSVGARMAREWLWQEYDFCGTKDLQEFRETICTLIRYHSMPPHILEQKNPSLRLLKIASNGELIPDFSIELLCMLEEADMKGRKSASVSESLKLIHICAEEAEKLGCLKSYFPFSTPFSEYAYLSGRNVLLGQELFDDTFGEVILMSGLPGTGKNTWISEHFGNYPMVSLDEIRKQMKISPKDDQNPVINAARELAKEYLRSKKTFIWNATNLTPVIRGKQVSLFESYHASVRIVYLETKWETQMERNQERKAEVPEHIIRKMLGNLVLPERFEACQVEWHCV